MDAARRPPNPSRILFFRYDLGMVRRTTGTVTGLLAEARAGDHGAVARIWDLVYGELYRMARSRVRALQPGQTLQATVLVHEVYLKLSRDGRFDWNDLGQFYSAAGRAMRDIMVDQERRKGRLKRQAGSRRVPLTEAIAVALAVPEAQGADLLGLDIALTKLEGAYPRAFEIVLLRFFAGLTSERAARALGLSPATAEREWTFAKAWLYRELRRQGGEKP